MIRINWLSPIAHRFSVFPQSIKMRKWPQWRLDKASTWDASAINVYTIIVIKRQQLVTAVISSEYHWVRYTVHPRYKYHYYTRGSQIAIKARTEHRSELCRSRFLNKSRRQLEEKFNQRNTECLSFPFFITIRMQNRLRSVNFEYLNIHTRTCSS